jgi:hypothetical protein
MAHKQKTGRTASQSQRDHAKRLLELHRLAEQSPDGSHCVNPDADPEEHTYVYADTILVHAMDQFARHGTFQNFPTSGIKRTIVRAELKRHIDESKSYGDAIYLLAQKYGCDERTIERWIRVTDIL